MDTNQNECVGAKPSNPAKQRWRNHGVVWCGVVWCGDSAGASQAEMENELRNSKKSTMRSKMTQIFFIFQQKK